MGPDRQHAPGAHRQNRPPARQHHQIDAGVKAAAVDAAQRLKIAVETLQQRAVGAQIGDPGEQRPRPGPGGDGALLGAAHTEEAEGAGVPPQQLDPGPGDDAAHREAEQVDRLLPPEGRLDMPAQQARRLHHRGAAEAQGQLGDQQRILSPRQGPQQPVEHPWRIEQAVHQHKWRWRGVPRGRGGHPRGSGPQASGRASGWMESR